MNLDLAPRDWRHEAASWSEEQLLRAVLSDCNLLRLDVKWDKQPRISTVKGWPDLIIIGPNGTLFRELKSMFGVLSVAQRAVGSKLARAGLDWQVWRPVEWYDGTIESQLLKIAARM